jgi:hypothetical protein
MRTVQIRNTEGIQCNESTVGEPIENKIKRALENGEPIEDGSELIFTERQEGVQHEYNIRSDKWEMAIDAIGDKTKSQLARRKELLDKKKPPEKTPGEEPASQ